jgi:hypothetical protein
VVPALAFLIDLTSWPGVGGGQKQLVAPVKYPSAKNILEIRLPLDTITQVAKQLKGRRDELICMMTLVGIASGPPGEKSQIVQGEPIGHSARPQGGQKIRLGLGAR